MSLIHQNKAGEFLFAVVGEAFVKVTRRWMPLPIEHVHAPEIHIARFRYLAGYEKKHVRVRVVAIAPAIGFFGDEHGERLVG